MIIYIIAAIIILDEHTQERTFNLDSLKNNPLWGILFIFVGIVLFFQYNHVLFLFWGSFWDNFLNILVAFILLGVGIYLLYNRRIEIKKTTEYNIGEEPLHLSIEDKKLAGVCGGFGESLNLDPNLVRVLWIFGTLMSVGIGILLYIVLALVLPERAIVSEDI